MIRELENRITEEQLDAIVKIIRERCTKYRKISQELLFDELFNGEYQTNKRKQGKTLAIHNGFPSNETIGNLSVEHMDYDSGRSQPKFVNDHIVMLLLFDSSSDTAKYLESYFAHNCNGFQNDILFAYIKVSFGRNDRMTITLNLPNANGQIYAKEELYSEEKAA